MNFRLITTLLILTTWATLSQAQHAHQSTPKTTEERPLHDQHPTKSHDHLGEVNRRGGQAMGFSQTKTAHHFRLKSDGGAIEVIANRRKDVVSRNQIRQHLQHIAQAFAAGDFSKPLHTHAQLPPGVSVMKERKAEIQYRYEALPRGGRVRLTTKNSEALQAIHEFLRFQITDHQTSDSLSVAPTQKRPGVNQ
jgi:hypothetical protein